MTLDTYSFHGLALDSSLQWPVNLNTFYVVAFTNAEVIYPHFMKQASLNKRSINKTNLDVQLNSILIQVPLHGHLSMCKN